MSDILPTKSEWEKRIRALDLLVESR